MTNEEALSILSKMDVEQRTLQSLWSQFSVALRQVSSVIEHFQAVASLLPEGEKRLGQINDELAGLEPELESKKAAIALEVSNHRSTLENELDTVRFDVKTARDQLVGVKQDLVDYKLHADARKTAIDKDVKETEDRLSSLRDAFESFKKSHGLGGTT